MDVEQFRMGLHVELEHGLHDPATDVTNNYPVVTGKIALAHLNEFPDYYTRLARMEEEARARSAGQIDVFERRAVPSCPPTASRSTRGGSVGRDAGCLQACLEARSIAVWAAHEDRQSVGSPGAARTLLGAQAPVHGGVDQMRVQRSVAAAISRISCANGASPAAV